MKKLLALLIATLLVLSMCSAAFADGGKQGREKKQAAFCPSDLPGAAAGDLPEQSAAHPAAGFLRADPANPHQRQDRYTPFQNGE